MVILCKITVKCYCLIVNEVKEEFRVNHQEMGERVREKRKNNKNTVIKKSQVCIKLEVYYN